MPDAIPPRRARDLVNRYGRAATCWQVLNPELSHWYTPDGRSVVGYAVLSPVPARSGWLVEQVMRGRKAPNGTAESMVSIAARALARRTVDDLWGLIFDQNWAARPSPPQRLTPG